MERALAGCSAVIHAVQTDAASAKRAAVVLCRAAAASGVRRVVYLSTAAVHGLNPPVGTNEATPLNLHHADPEVNARVSGERQFFTECRRLNLTGYALRPALVYGPRSPLVARIASELRSDRAWLLRNGAGLTNCLYVDNLIAAIRLCLKAKNGAGQAYLLADAEDITWRDFYVALARELELPGSRITSLPDSAAAVTRTPGVLDVPAGLTVDAQRATQQTSTWRLANDSAAKNLGYAPAVTFAEAIRRTAGWWRFAEGDFSVAA